MPAMSTTAERAASIETRNPANGEVIRSYEPHDEAALETKLAAAVAAAARWRETAFDERAERLRAAARYLREHKSELAELATREMGKPIAESEAEVDKCATSCEWFAANGERLLAQEETASNATRSYVAFRPLGVLLAIMPWNFPYWQVFRAASPALMAGNVVVLKHAANVSGTLAQDRGDLPGERVSAGRVHHAADRQPRRWSPSSATTASPRSR